MSDTLTKLDHVRLSPAQVSDLASLLDRGEKSTIYMDTVRGRFAVTLAPAEAALAAPGAESRAVTTTVCAGSVGEFLTSHPQRAALFVTVGQRVQHGDLLALVRTGPLLTPVVFDGVNGRTSRLVRCLAEPGALVGYGTPLFELEC